MGGISKIGIDFWGMLLYLVNYGILLALLGYFFYPKIMKTIDKRRQTIQKNLEDADRLQKELNEQLEKHKQEQEKMQAQMQAQSAELKKELDDKRAAMLADVDKERQNLIDETKAQLAQEKAEIFKTAEKEILGVMKKVLTEVIGKSVPEKAMEQSVSDSWNKYASIK